MNVDDLTLSLVLILVLGLVLSANGGLIFLEYIHPAFDACSCTKQSHDNCPRRAEYTAFFGRFEPNDNRGDDEGKPQKCNE